MNDSEQHSRITNVENVGLRAPSVSETDESVFINFCKDVLEVELVESDFEEVHVVPSKTKDNKHVVIASCKSRKPKKVILNNKFKVREFNDGRDPHEKNFLYEQLSPANRKIFALASKKKYDLNYKFIWTRRGTTYLRKDESAKTQLKHVLLMLLINLDFFSFDNYLHQVFFVKVVVVLKVQVLRVLYILVFSLNFMILYAAFFRSKSRNSQ